MIIKAKWEPQFFINLFGLLKDRYSTLFITQSGRIFQKEHQASDRCKELNRIENINNSDSEQLTWIRVDYVDAETTKAQMLKYYHNPSLFDELFEEQSKKRRITRIEEEKANAEAKSMEAIVADAKAALLGDSPIKDAETKEVGNGLVDSYGLDAVKKALKEVVGLHHSAGAARVESVIADLSEEQMKEVVSILDNAKQTD